MRAILASLLVLGFSIPGMAQESESPAKPATASKSKTKQKAKAPLKTTPDPLPEGLKQFNGMLIGQLAAKDVEKGTFVVRVDAVPRVWRNSKAKAPKSIVGKTVQVSGVFGKFLDVLVVTRKGETLEFECKHDGGGLVFPGELLRKIAKFDPQHYPELPEAFRGFQGAVVADIKHKDAETLEMILEVQDVLDIGKENRAKKPASIEGRRMMLAGFWNRRETYHDLKVGDRIQVGMKHISLRSDHLSLNGSVKKIGSAPKSGKMKMEKSGQVADGLPESLRGFRGMLVGKLIKKDVERGTFSIQVDAVPRVWRNNQAKQPKAFIGKQVDADRVHSKMLDALVVTRIGETLEFGALHEGGETVRVGEVLRKVAPVKPGDYPELPEGFRGFRGIVHAKVVKKDEHLLGLIVEITKVGETSEKNRAKRPTSIVGKPVMLSGFWRKKELFHGLRVGDRIASSIEHTELLSDHLNVTGAVQKIEK